MSGTYINNLKFQAQENAVRLGNSAALSAEDGAAIGPYAESNAQYAIALGRNAIASGYRSMALGRGSEANTDYAVTIGDVATASAQNALVTGRNETVATANVARIGQNQLVFGGNDGGTIANADLNNGEITIEFDEANTQFIIRGKDSSGTVQTATVTY